MSGTSAKIGLFRLVQIALGWVLRLLFLVSRHGMRRIPKDGPIIVASNHTSFLDPLVVVASLHRPLFHVGRRYLFRKGLMSFVLETLGGQIPLNEEAGNQAALEAGVGVLERGLALGIYPEGTRSPNGRLLRGHTGVALFAYRTGAPVYPVAIAGAFRAWPRHKRWPRLFRRIRILVGEPIQVAKDPQAADDPRRCRKLTDDIMTALAGLLGQEYERSKFVN